MFTFGVSVGLRSIFRGHFKIGLKRVIHPVSYWRYPVFNLVKKYVKHQENLSVLDIGSPKLLALYLAISKKFNVISTDIQDPEIFSVWLKYYNDYLISPSKREDRSSFRPEYQDARALSYPDNYFDMVYSISVIEHIPGDGDSVAIKEVARVLRPGGSAIIEVPFSDKKYNSFVSKNVYDRQFSGHPIFYQRHYDCNSIYDRIIYPSELSVEEMYIFKERLPFEGNISRLPIYCQIPLLFLSAVISKFNHQRLVIKSLTLMKKNDEKTSKNIMIFLKKI